MVKKQLLSVFFSPNGSTKRVADQMAAQWESAEAIDLLKAPLREDLQVRRDGFVTIALPVYAGRIPGVCREMLRHLRGDHTPAAAVVVYGNREYEDALRELCDLLTEQGFQVGAAAAFVAEHSIFHTVAAGRPDQRDMELIREFAENCKAAEARLRAGDPGRVTPKGNFPYREAKGVPLTPHTGCGCIKCGICARLCPVQAIDPADPGKTDKDRCIACGACIARCPEKAREFSGLTYMAASMKFEKEHSAYKSPEMFYME